VAPGPSPSVHLVCTLSSHFLLQHPYHGPMLISCSCSGTGVGFAGSISGVYCTYKAMLSAGDNNNTPPSSIPGPQTASPSTGMLASYTGLPIGNWQLQLKGICGSGSKVKITDAVVDGWVGEQGGQVTSRKLDSADSVSILLVCMNSNHSDIPGLLVYVCACVGAAIFWCGLVDSGRAVRPILRR